MNDFDEHIDKQLGYVGGMSEIEQLRAEVAQLRAALDAVEWVDDSDVDENVWFTCPWCKNDEEDGHKPDCQRQKALGL